MFSEPFFDTSLLPWHSLRLVYHLKSWTALLSKEVVILPSSMSISAVLVQFRDLWKIRAPLNSCCGFSMQPFDEVWIFLIQNCFLSLYQFYFSSVCICRFILSFMLFVISLFLLFLLPFIFYLYSFFLIHFWFSANSYIAVCLFLLCIKFEFFFFIYVILAAYNIFHFLWFSFF